MFVFRLPGDIEWPVNTKDINEALDVVDKIIKMKDFKGGAIDYYDRGI